MLSRFRSRPGSSKRNKMCIRDSDWSLQYYLNSDGQWEKLEGIINVFNEAFYDPNFYASDMSGMLLYGGDSVTFSLPCLLYTSRCV